MTPVAWLVCCLCVHWHDTCGMACVLLMCVAATRLSQMLTGVGVGAWLTCKCSSNSRLARNTSWVRCCTCLLYSSSCFCSRINASSFKRDNCSSTVLCCCSNSLIRVCKMLICRLWSASPSSRLLWINQQCQVSSVKMVSIHSGKPIHAPLHRSEISLKQFQCWSDQQWHFQQMTRLFDPETFCQCYPHWLRFFCKSHVW